MRRDAILALVLLAPLASAATHIAQKPYVAEGLGIDLLGDRAVLTSSGAHADAVLPAESVEVAEPLNGVGAVSFALSDAASVLSLLASDATTGTTTPIGVCVVYDAAAHGALQNVRACDPWVHIGTANLRGDFRANDVVVAQVYSVGISNSAPHFGTHGTLTLTTS